MHRSSGTKGRFDGGTDVQSCGKIGVVLGDEEIGVVKGPWGRLPQVKGERTSDGSSGTALKGPGDRRRWENNQRRMNRVSLLCVQSRGAILRNKSGIGKKKNQKEETVKEEMFLVDKKVEPSRR